MFLSFEEISVTPKTFQIYLTCDHQAEKVAMEIQSISTFGVFQRSIQSRLRKIYVRYLLRKANFAFMIQNPSLDCSYVVLNFWANLSLVVSSYKIVLIKKSVYAITANVSCTRFFLLRTSKILPRLNVLIFFQQFEAQNVLILFLTAIYSFIVENRPQRPSGVYVCPVFSSRTCVHARHVILSCFSWSILVLK